jgi:hypothetical protein
VNAESVFFFCGSPRDFTSFLKKYSELAVAEGHRLVLHGGDGEARSPWASNGERCEWKLYSAPEGWVMAHKLLEARTNVAAIHALVKGRTNYVITVHFWTNGFIPLDLVKIPSNVKVEQDR